MKKLSQNQRDIYMIFGIILVVIVIGVMLIFINPKGNKKKEEAITLEKELENIGVYFYENHYYTTLNEEQKRKLSDFSNNGIKIDIKNIELLVPIEESIKNKFHDRNCNYDKTKITIYPEEPYGQKDYTISLELFCDK